MQYRHLFPMVRILLPFLAGIVACTAVSATIGSTFLGPTGSRIFSRVDYKILSRQLSRSRIDPEHLCNVLVYLLKFRFAHSN